MEEQVIIRLPEGMTEEEFKRAFKRWERREELRRQGVIKEVDDTCKRCIKEIVDRWPGEDNVGPDCLCGHHFGDNIGMGGCSKLDAYYYELYGNEDVLDELERQREEARRKGSNT